MTTCATGITYGWGAAAWGATGWGGYGAPVLGGPIPTMPPFDLYCLCSGWPMEYAQSYDEVSTTPYDHFSVDSVAHDLVITSNDSVEAQLMVDISVPETYTFEFTATFQDLPDSFVDVGRRIYFGVVNHNGYSAGVLCSSIGLAYLGNPGTAFQVLPDSEDLVQEGILYVCRIVVNAVTQAVFIYWSKVDDAVLYGPQLRYIMPLIPYSTSSPAPEGTHVRVIGTASKPSSVALDSMCLSSQVLISNVPPVADAGTDQAVRTCSIIQLDGSKSFDPEGAPVVYKWRLIDGPVGSQFVFEGLDGSTTPLDPATGYTDKLYSSSFGGSSPIPADAGDVLYVMGEAYDIVEVSSDLHGDFVRITRHLLADSWTGKPFKVLKQHGLSGPTQVKPTFYPDMAGFWRFDLVVFDGALYSAPSVTVVNVLQSLLPRGVIPDASFVWQALSDFWRLVEDPERLAVMWSAFAQIVATELYTLWQYEYSKSLRDIQKTFVRRWLHYDLLLREPFVDLVKIRMPMRGIDSSPMAVGGLLLGGKSVTFILPDNTLCKVSLVAPSLVTPENMAKQIRESLQKIDTRFDCKVVNLGATTSVVRVLAPFQFDVHAVDSPVPFTVGQANALLEGTDGIVTGVRSYKLPMCASGVVLEDDVLVLTDTLTGNLVTARIASVGDAPTDTHRFQRLLLKDDIPLSCGTKWYIPARAISTQLDFYRGLVTEKDLGVIETIDKDFSDVVYHDVECFGANENLPNSVLLRWENLPLYLASPARYEVFFWGVYRRGYMPIENKIVDIPNLQRVINSPDEEEVLRCNLDYYIDTFRNQRCLRFNPLIWDPEDTRTLVPRLWAEYNYLDNNDLIEANFGIPVGFSVDDLKQLPGTVDYLHAVKGLWYAYTKGPTIYNLRIGTQILLGLPFAEEAGTITEIRDDFSPTHGRILIRDTENSDVVRAYPYPRALTLETNPSTGEVYKENDTVTQFAPLVTGVEVVDHVKDPRWFQGILSQGVFYEVEKFFKFLVRVDGDVFNLSALLFAKEFVKSIKPTYTFPMFVVHKDTGDDGIDVEDDVRYVGYLRLEVGSVWWCGTDSSTGADDPDPSPGWMEYDIEGNLIGPKPYVDAYGSQGNFSSHYQTAADTADDRSVVLPTMPASDLFVFAGADRALMSPEAAIWALQRADLAVVPFPDHVSGHIVADSIYRADYGLYVYGEAMAVFGQQFFLHADNVWHQLRDTYVAVGAQTFKTIEVEIHGRPIADSIDFIIGVSVNDIVVVERTFVHTGGDQSFYVFDGLAITVADTDVVKVLIKGRNKCRPFWYAVTVTLGSITPVFWADGGDTGPWAEPPWEGPVIDPNPEAVMQRVRTL